MRRSLHRVAFLVVGSVVAAVALVVVALGTGGPCAPPAGPSAPSSPSGLAGSGAAPSHGGGDTGGDRTPLNVVLIVTDDQRADTLWAMPRVRRLLGGHGVTFTNFFVTTSLCCPSRASILTGQYSRHTGVFDNIGDHGGIQAFRDRSTLATWLSGGGYSTGMIGKYLNGYARESRCYFPAGWTEWHAIASRPAHNYYDFALNDDGRIDTFVGRTGRHYSTNVLASRARTFIRRTRSPFFLYLAPNAPHRPAIPARRDRGTMEGAGPRLPPSFDELDVSDKPWGARRPLLDAADLTFLRRFREREVEALRSVDRAVGSIVRTLRRRGLLDRTVILYTSDNGFLLGEHRLQSKVWPYEESIRVPLVVRVPWATSGRTDRHLALNIDLAPTIAELGGVRPRLPEDGRSLVPLLLGKRPAWRHAFIVEWLSDRPTTIGAPPPFDAIRTEGDLYVEYRNGWRELYDLRADPFELHNLAGDPSARRLERRLARRLHSSMRR